MVLDDHLRDENAEWRDFGTVEDIARGNVPGKRARCGDVPTDETRWVGGLMPTTVGREPYYPSTAAAAGGGAGGGGGSSNAEERQKLASLRSRLKRTHNMIENMLEKEQKERYREVVLDHKARAAKVARGEEDDDGNNNIMELDTSVTVQGDYEAFIAAERQQRTDEGNTTLNLIAKTDENQYTALNNKWSLTHAILIHGTLEYVQEWAGDYNNGGGEWTHASLENERRHLHKKLDATTRSSTHKLYVSFVLLEKAARALNFHGIANPTFREATSWLVKFATARDDLKISGISSGKKGGKHLENNNGDEELLSLSLYPRSDSDMMETLLSSSLMAKSSSRKPSMWNELHRLKQYSALGAAILYVSAKRTGVGRTLAEVCSAFGTYSIGADEIKRNDVESLVRPKYCSRAMEELKQALSDVLSPIDRTAVQPVKTSSPCTNLSGDKLSMVSSTEQLESLARVTPDYLPSDMSNNAEESALADLISRMASSLNLPSSAAVAARAVATQCKIDGSRVSNGADKTGTSKHIRPRQRKSKMKSDSDEIIAAASLLLVSAAGGIMQRLAEQALSNAGASCEIGVDTFASWNEWNSQSSWHRDVSDLEQCTGLPSKDIADCYSKTLHHRRARLLEAVKLRFKMGNEERERLLQNIVVAVPLMSLRHMG